MCCFRFYKGERTFPYKLDSPNVKRFHAKDKDVLIQTARDHCQAMDVKKVCSVGKIDLQVIQNVLNSSCGLCYMI